MRRVERRCCKEILTVSAQCDEQHGEKNPKSGWHDSIVVSLSLLALGQQPKTRTRFASRTMRRPLLCTVFMCVSNMHDTNLGLLFDKIASRRQIQSVAVCGTYVWNMCAQHPCRAVSFAPSRGVELTLTVQQGVATRSVPPRFAWRACQKERETKKEEVRDSAGGCALNPVNTIWIGNTLSRSHAYLSFASSVAAFIEIFKHLLALDSIISIVCIWLRGFFLFIKIIFNIRPICQRNL